MIPPDFYLRKVFLIFVLIRKNEHRMRILGWADGFFFSLTEVFLFCLKWIGYGGLLLGVIVEGVY